MRQTLGLLALPCLLALPAALLAPAAGSPATPDIEICPLSFRNVLHKGMNECPGYTLNWGAIGLPGADGCLDCNVTTMTATVTRDSDGMVMEYAADSGYIACKEAEDNIGKSISVDCPGDGEEWYTMHAICKKCKTFE